MLRGRGISEVFHNPICSYLSQRQKLLDNNTKELQIKMQDQNHQQEPSSTAIGASTSSLAAFVRRRFDEGALADALVDEWSEDDDDDEWNEDDDDEPSLECRGPMIS